MFSPFVAPLSPAERGPAEKGGQATATGLYETNSAQMDQLTNEERHDIPDDLSVLRTVNRVIFTATNKTEAGFDSRSCPYFSTLTSFLIPLSETNPHVKVLTSQTSSVVY